jgi:hypothetical protein
MIVWPVIIDAIIAEQCSNNYETTIRARGAYRCPGHVRSRRLGLWLATLTNHARGLSIEAAIFPIGCSLNKREDRNEICSSDSPSAQARLS